jgi:hypothetical protein
MLATLGSSGLRDVVGSISMPLSADQCAVHFAMPHPPRINARQTYGDLRPASQVL